MVTRVDSITRSNPLALRMYKQKNLKVEYKLRTTIPKPLGMRKTKSMQKIEREGSRNSLRQIHRKKVSNQDNHPNNSLQQGSMKTLNCLQFDHY